MIDRPVFVAGLERTGTSLMYALLASHSQIAMTRRTNFWRYFADQYGDLGEDKNLDECLAMMRVYKRLVVLDIDFDLLRSEFMVGQRTYGRLFALLERQVAAREGKPRWGDKSLNIERYAERLLQEYPEARILHMIRDPRDRLASSLTRWGRGRAGTGTGTGIASWNWSARLASHNLARHARNYRVVRYESLVRDPETELRAICDFIDEQYEDQMLTMQGAASFRDNGSNSSYGARPVGTISTNSIHKFSDVLKPTQIALVQAATREQMVAHGYSAVPVSLSPSEQLRLALVDRPSSALVSSAWQARERLANRRGRPLPDYRKVLEPA